VGRLPNSSKNGFAFGFHCAVEMVALASCAMSKWPASWRVILLFVFCCILSGCLPTSDTPVDDEKDPNFIEGRTHENMMDWKGAVEAFDRAIQANPHNAAAHFELGFLYQDRLNDPLAAAYHFQKHLQLRPNSDRLEVIKPRLMACKMDIAKTVTFGVVNEQVHRDLAKLTEELAAAKKFNEELRAHIAAKPTVVTQWMKFTVTNTVLVAVQPTNTTYRAAVTNSGAQSPRSMATNAVRITPLSTVPTNNVRRAEQRTPTTSSQFTARTPEVRTPVAAPARPRTYVVKSGETMAEVARRTGISLQKIEAANPTIEPRRLRAGQTLNIPSQ
jgi:LysM repeat protein